VLLYLAVSVVILLASFLFAMLGLGGGMVYVPVLKWAGFPVKEEAIPLGLLLNGLNTLLALIPFARNRLVDWPGGLAMAVTASLLAPVGAHTAQQVPVKALMLLFATATTAFVVTFSSFSGYLGYMAEGPMNWPLTLALVVAILLGSQLGGTFMSTKAKPHWVKTLYAAVLLAIAVKLIVDVVDP
jgi:uncharacterized membrane protein YfcA